MQSTGSCNNESNVGQLQKNKILLNFKLDCVSMNKQWTREQNKNRHWICSETQNGKQKQWKQTKTENWCSQDCI